jgi:N-acetylglutamate synthase-like GNAT family acetyltransferase
VKTCVTEDYAALIPFFIENGLEFDENEEYGGDEIVKCWRSDDANGRLVGGCILATREGEYICDGIAVAPSERDTGLGKVLLGLLLDEVRALGGDKVFLVARAPGFFKKSGFVTIPRAAAPEFFECFSCPQYQKTCFPEVMRLDLYGSS